MAHTILWDVSTKTLPDAFDRYLVGMADLYDVSGVSDEDRANFFNTSQTTLTTSGVVGWGRSVRQTLSRDAGMLRRSGVDGFNIFSNQTAVVGDCDGRTLRASPGCLQFRDMARVSSSRLDTICLSSVLIPRAVASQALLAADIHGVALPPDLPGVRLVVGQLEAVLALAEQLSEPDLEVAMQALLMVATKVLGAEEPADGEVLAALQSTVRRLAGVYVEERLENAQAPIDLSEMARVAGVSRATLYRAFGGDKGVRHYIQGRRLHRARVALRARQDGKPTISEIAYDHGFPSASHFSRLFRERYGYSPSDIEPVRPNRELAMSDGPIRHDLLAKWLHKFTVASE